MREMLLALCRDYREIRDSAAFRITCIVLAIVTVAAAIAIPVALRLQAWYGDAGAVPVLDLIAGLVAYFLPLFVLLSFIWAFASLPVVREKVNGNIECLMATPLGPASLWAGKALAIFLPSYVLSLAGAWAVLLALNMAAVLPGWDAFALPVPALVNGLIVNPLLFLGMLSFVILLSLIGNPDTAIGPSFLVGFGLMIGMPVGLITGTFDILSWSFTLWYFAGTVVMWVAVLCLSRLLTRQNIVLSSRGG